MSLLKLVPRRGDIFGRKQVELINNTLAVLNKGDVVIVDRTVDTDNSAIAPSTTLLNNSSIVCVYAGLLPLAIGAYGFFDVTGKFLVTVDPQIATPTTAATGAGASTGSTLTAGAYFVKYTWYNAQGETDAGTSESAAVTTTSGQVLTVTVPSIPSGATGAHVYITAVGGAAGSEQFLAGNITSGTTLAISANPTVAGTPPTTNTAGWAAGTLLKVSTAAATGGTSLTQWVADANSKVRVVGYNTLPSIKGTPVAVVMDGEGMGSGYAATA